MRIDRRRYAELYGPTTGDRFRLADTNLLIRGGLIEDGIVITKRDRADGNGEIGRAVNKIAQN